jgi:hypothetical protein
MENGIQDMEEIACMKSQGYCSFDGVWIRCFALERLKILRSDECCWF